MDTLQNFFIYYYPGRFANLFFSSFFFRRGLSYLHRKTESYIMVAIPTCNLLFRLPSLVCGLWLSRIKTLYSSQELYM
jgi:hypothetical protein